MVAAAFWAAAAVGVEAERGREYRAGGGDLAEPGIEHASDERGMFGNAHRGPRQGSGTARVDRLIGKAGKKSSANRIWGRYNRNPGIAREFRPGSWIICANKN